MSFVTIASECPEPWRAMCSIASSSESTTATASVSARYSVSQSSSLAGVVSAAASPACSAARSSTRNSTPASLERGQCSRQESRCDIGVDEQRLSRVAHARTLRLGVQHDRKRIVEIRGGVHVDVAVTRRGIDDRHARHLLQRRLQTLAAARDDQVDQPVLGRQLGQLPRPPPATRPTQPSGSPTPQQPRPRSRQHRV